MPYDATQALQASVTKTATFNGPWLDLGGGSGVPSPMPSGATPAFGLVARIEYSAATNVSGANGVEWSLDTSDDGSTVAGAAAFQAADKILALSTTAQSGEVFIPFEVRHRYVRLTVTVSGAGSTPTVTYQGEIVPSWP